MYCDATATLQPPGAVKGVPGGGYVSLPCLSITVPGSWREMLIVDLVWGKKKAPNIRMPATLLGLNAFLKRH